MVSRWDWRDALPIGSCQGRQRITINILRITDILARFQLTTVSCNMFPKTLQIGSEARQASYWVGILCCFPGLKRREREVYHSSPSITEVKNEWVHTSDSPVCLHGVDKDNSTFIFLPCYSSNHKTGIQSAAGKTGVTGKWQIKWSGLSVRLLDTPSCTLIVTP